MVEDLNPGSDMAGRQAGRWKSGVFKRARDDVAVSRAVNPGYGGRPQ